MHTRTHLIFLPSPVVLLLHSHTHTHLHAPLNTPIHARYNFNAFLNGPRNCLGSHLALLEARIVLSLLNQRFTFTPVDEKSGEVDEFTVPTCPKNGMWVYVN
jgi:cytochrome P450